ncbi:hypothetical protein [Methylomonas sp. MK1]|nr:hypothetical protein [Methylomonas sp. MK1]
MATIGGIITIMGMVTGPILGDIAQREWAITRPRRPVILGGRR